MELAKIKPTIEFEDFEKIDIGYADGIDPALAVPEKGVPNGSRAG